MKLLKFHMLLVLLLLKNCLALKIFVHVLKRFVLVPMLWLLATLLVRRSTRVLAKVHLLALDVCNWVGQSWCSAQATKRCGLNRRCEALATLFEEQHLENK